MSSTQNIQVRYFKEQLRLPGAVDASDLDRGGASLLAALLRPPQELLV